MGAASEIVLQGCGHEGRQLRHPVGQQQASPRHLSERQAAPVPGRVLIRIPEGLHYGVQHLICHLLHSTKMFSDASCIGHDLMSCTIAL